MLRNFFIKDFGWKLLALALAVSIWVTVKGFSSDSSAQTKERVFTDLPAQIVSGTTDARKFRINPETVQVTVKGLPNAIKALTEREIHVYVDVDAINIDPTRNFRKRVEVTAPTRITIYKVEPAEVEVVVPPRPSTAAPHPTS